MRTSRFLLRMRVTLIPERRHGGSIILCLIYPKGGVLLGLLIFNFKALHMCTELLLSEYSFHEKVAFLRHAGLVNRFIYKGIRLSFVCLLITIRSMWVCVNLISMFFSVNRLDYHLLCPLFRTLKKASKLCLLLPKRLEERIQFQGSLLLLHLVEMKDRVFRGAELNEHNRCIVNAAVPVFLEFKHLLPNS